MHLQTYNFKVTKAVTRIPECSKAKSEESDCSDIENVDPAQQILKTPFQHQFFCGKVTQQWTAFQIFIHVTTVNDLEHCVKGMGAIL